LTAEEREKAETEIAALIRDAFARADADPFPVLGNQVRR
jgi:hypothetical protein